MSKLHSVSAYLADIRYNSARIEALFVVPHRSGKPFYKILTDPVCIQAICFKLQLPYKNSSFTAHIMSQRLAASIERKEPLAYRLVQSDAYKRPWMKFLGNSITGLPFNPEHKKWEFFKESIDPTPDEVKKFLIDLNVDCDKILNNYKIFQGFRDLPIGYIPIAWVEEFSEIHEELRIVAGAPSTDIWVPGKPNLEDYLSDEQMNRYFTLVVEKRNNFNKISVPDSTNFSSSNFSFGGYR